MVKHIILWKLREDLTQDQKIQAKRDIKEGLEGLKGQIPGMTDIKVNIDGLPSSTADLMLDSTFVDYDSLKGYAVHPKHLAVANGKVRPNTDGRYCLDFEE